MKKLVVFLCVAGVMVSSSSTLFAGGIENKHNWSAEYIRTLNRNAATDSVDAVVYNPAGVMKMENGFYLGLAGQYAIKEYSNKYLGIEYDTDEPDFIPSLFTLYKKDKWAAYGAVTVVVAGGEVDFKDGDTTTKMIADYVVASATIPSPPAPFPGIPAFDAVLNHQIKGESYFIGYTLGGAYAINDMVSVSLGARYVDASREFRGHATLRGANPLVPDTTLYVDYEETGHGWGGIIGVNIAPTEKLNIGLRYETKTSIDLRTDEKTDDIDLITDGFKRNRDLPALAGLGVSYKFTPKIKVDANFTWYLNNDVDWDDNPITVGNETQKDNGYDIGIACEYTFNTKWKASVGYMYTEVGIDPDNIKVETPELNANTIAGGIAYKATPDLDLNLGVLYVFYKDEKTSTGIKYEKDVTLIGAGIQYKFF